MKIKRLHISGSLGLRTTQILTLVLPFIFLMGPNVGLGATSYRVTKSGGSAQIKEFSICRRVTNNRSLDLFVPTKTAAEWSAFRSKVPASVTAAYCYYNQNCAAAGSIGNCTNTFTCPHGSVRRLKMVCSTQEQINHTATINGNTWNTAEVIGSVGPAGGGCKIGSSSYPTGTTSISGHPAIGAASFSYNCQGNCTIYVQVECGD